MEREFKTERQFTTKVLPWIVAAAALVFYLLTINRWVNFNNLVPVAKVAGLVWQPELANPLLWLVTYPFRWLPVHTIPLALNLFAAVCAALTLALLARTVALLPHDRTEEQRIREHSETGLLSAPWAWIPPLIAVFVCGLQMSFWEHATALSVEMFDLLLFAYVVRALMEFRLDGRESWLFKTALLYGASMANNFGMVAFFPIFLVALVWVRGFGFFNTAFLSRMFLLGSIGLLAYLLLPLVVSLSGDGNVSFWQALKWNLGGQKTLLTQIVFNKQRLFSGAEQTDPLWVLGLASLLPVFLMGIRWPAYFGDPSRLGVALTTLILHVFHAVILGLCLWVSLDPEMGPRRMFPAFPMLPLYYLGALSVGYYLGYFLLIFGTRPAARSRPAFILWPIVNRAIVALTLLVTVAAAVALLYRNLPEIRLTNGKLVSQYAAHVTARWPSAGAVVLSDDPRKSLLTRLWMQRQKRADKFLFIETGSVQSPDYHFYLKKSNPDKVTWAMPTNRTERLEDIEAVNMLLHLSQSNQLAYLHASFGYYFEYFFPEAHGMTYFLHRYETNTVAPPAASKELIAENQAFWKQVENTTLKTINDALRPGPPQGVDRIFERLHLPKAENWHVKLFLAPWYSLAANYWGVSLQRAGELAAARSFFDLAVALNEDNVVAKINRMANQNLQAGLPGTVQKLGKEIEDEFGKQRDWDSTIGAYGPYDEANRVMEQGHQFVQKGSNYRQALLQYRRAVELNPDDLHFRIGLGTMYLILRRPTEALEISDSIRRDASKLGVTSTNTPALVGLEASAHFSLGNLEGGQKVIKAALQKEPTNEELLNKLSDVYSRYGLYTNLAEIVDQQMRLRPNDPNLLTMKGYCYMQMGDLKSALPPLDAALSITNHPTARLNRAVTSLRLQDWEQARKDYESLLKDYPGSPGIHYGLGEVAWNTTNLDAAARHYSLYLSNTAPNMAYLPETTNVLARLKELKKGYR